MSESQESTLFCPVCGASVTEEMMFCPSCGTTLSFTTCPGCNRKIAGEKYCPYCGTRLLPTKWSGIFKMYLITIGCFLLLSIAWIFVIIVLAFSFAIIAPLDPYIVLQLVNDFQFLFISLMNAMELIFLIPLILYFKKVKKMLTAIGISLEKIKSSIPEEIVFALLGFFVALGLQATFSYFNLISTPSPAIYSPIAYIALGLSLAIVAFAEEALFRGYFYQAITNKRNFVTGVLVSSLIFATVHPVFPTFFVAFALGLCLAVIYEKSERNLATVVLFHYIYDLTIFLYPTLLYILT